MESLSPYIPIDLRKALVECTDLPDRAQGDYPFACQLYNESLLINRELGDGWQIAYLLEDMGSLAALQGHSHKAIRLVSSATALRERIGATLSPTDQEKLERRLKSACRSLGQAEITAAQEQGQAMDLEQTIEKALLDPDAATKGVVSTRAGS